MKKIVATGLVALTLSACVPAAPSYQYQPTEDDAANVMEARQIALETHESGKPFLWKSKSGLKGKVTPIETYQLQNGTYCRTFLETIHTRSEQTVRSTACRNAAGQWVEPTRG